MASLRVRAAVAFGCASAVLIVIAGILKYMDTGFPDLSAVVGVALALAAIAVAGDRREDLGFFSTPRWLFGAAFASALVPVLPIIIHPGLPAFQHDWRWPLEQPDLQRWAPQMLLAWDPSVWGARTQFPGIDPAIVMMSLMAYVLPSKAVLVLMLVSCICAGALGAATVAARLVGASSSAALAAVAYACNPVVINKLGAGHTLFFVAYATLPWMFLVMSSGGSAWRRVGAGGLLLALSSVQPQFLVFDAIVCWVGSAASLDRKRWLAAAGATCLGLIAASPAIVANLGGPSGDFRLPTLPWELTLSSLPSEAIAWDGYFARYFQSAGGAGSAIPYVMLTALAVLVAWRSRFSRALGTLMGVGLLIIMGFQGPLAGFDRWLLERWSYAAAFRELYHAAPLVAFPASVLAASAVGMLRGSARLVTASVLAAALLGTGAISAPWALPSFTGRSIVDEAGVFIRANGSGVASLPLVHPVGVSGHFGPDPSAWSDARLSAYWTYEPSQPALAVGAAFQCGSPGSARLLAHANVSGAVVHKGWTSGLDVAPSIPVRRVASCLSATDESLPSGAEVRSSSSGDEVAAFAPTSNGAWIAGELPITTRLDDACDGRMPPHFTDGSTLSQPLALDPSQNWVPARPFYLEHVDFAFAPATGTFTRSTIPLPIPTESPVTRLLVWAPSGARIVGDRGRDDVRPNAQIQWITVDVGSDLRLIPHGETVLFGWSPEVSTTTVGDCVSSPLRWERSGRDSWSLRLSEGSSGTLIFRQRFDRGWNLHVDSCEPSEHFVADGFANGWYVPCAAKGIATATFEPQRPLDAALAFSSIAWSLCAGFFAWDGVLRLRRTQRP